MGRAMRGRGRLKEDIPRIDEGRKGCVNDEE